MHLDRFDQMPPGWRVDRSWGSPERGWLPICNGKSLLNGGKKGLLRLNTPCTPDVKLATVLPRQVTQKAAKAAPSSSEKQAIAQATNRLAREKFKLKLMQEITFDLMVCKIEGWDSRQYVAELKHLIDETYRKVNAPKRLRQQARKSNQMGLFEEPS